MILDSIKAEVGEDELLLLSSKDGKMTAKSLPPYLVQRRQIWHGMTESYYKNIWSSDIPARMCFFTWEVLPGAVFTKERLLKINPIIDASCSL